eukprot:CAMPEP_0168622112 /NCGR_PEP_ID=MMETSP0449_2-20121227/8080_1 /TAXON_ID=1082188 /ORGANISM="Strombidium rassoulzadegani, Strain ras09" /LENGTH=35 /DNA_ID= /DNA_START= /DNA_END= /DNA_ORIENTATION=
MNGLFEGLMSRPFLMIGIFGILALHVMLIMALIFT